MTSEVVEVVQGPAPVVQIIQDRGPRGVTFQGDWTAGTLYQIGDVVISDGSAFFVTAAHTSGSTAPTVAVPGANYHLLAQRGAQGPAGAASTVPGPANALSIGTVTTGAAGSAASATISGESPNQVLDLAIPRGATGSTGSTGPGFTWRGNWVSGTSYSARDIVRNSEGAIFQANNTHSSSTQPTIATPTSNWAVWVTPGPAGAAGAGVNWRGNWATSTAYAVGDIVKNAEGAIFMVTTAHTSGTTPTIASPGANYALWVTKGDTGSGGGGSAQGIRPRVGLYVGMKDVTTVSASGVTSGYISAGYFDILEGNYDALAIGVSTAMVLGSGVIDFASVALFQDDGTRAHPNWAQPVTPWLNAVLTATGNVVVPFAAPINIPSGRYWGVWGYRHSTAPTTGAALRMIGGMAGNYMVEDMGATQTPRGLYRSGQTALPNTSSTLQLNVSTTSVVPFMGLRASA